MIEKGVIQGSDGRAVKLIRKVVFTYRLEDDPKEMERTMVLEHTGAGGPIDGIIWNDELMRKIAYLEGDGCTEAKKQEGTDEWKTYAKEGERSDCFWLHNVDCIWEHYCDDM